MPNLGIENDKLMACPSSPNCVSSQAGDEVHFIEPIKAKGSTSTVKSTLLKILNGSARTTIIQTEDNYIRAEFVSRFFRFVDDVEFLILEMSPDESVVHVRSASRLGHSDFGVNRKRVEKIRDQFTAMNKEH